MATDPAEWLLRVSASHVEKTRILCSLTPNEFYSGADSSIAADIEPPPLFDYHKIHVMIGIGRPFLSKHDIKRWDYLADARRKYFQIHQNFYKAFHDLQDAQAYQRIMVTRKGELEKQIVQGEYRGTANAVIDKYRRDLEDVVWNLTKNRLEMPLLGMALSKRAKMRDRAAAWLSSMKMYLLQDDLPALMKLVRQLLQNQQRFQANQVANTGTITLPANATDLVIDVPGWPSYALGAATKCDAALANGSATDLTIP